MLPIKLTTCVSIRIICEFIRRLSDLWTCRPRVASSVEYGRLLNCRTCQIWRTNNDRTIITIANRSNVLYHQLTKGVAAFSSKNPGPLDHLMEHHALFSCYIKRTLYDVTTSIDLVLVQTPQGIPIPAYVHVKITSTKNVHVR
ncbi:hypothetical protein NP493_49g03041 [Ridgeia piscesae]|uniref:Uncharacterized protein n=1 Tax=Ridgeia piscesae TaxID=27915 RepID=A0AAD9UJC9_RIDPI|nr:hypothetical protein NP493_49g03041 [Ridgeia piscesae]